MAKEVAIQEASGSIRKVERVVPEKPHAEMCHHEWKVIRNGPPPHWDKGCRLCGATETMTPEEAFAD